MEKLFKYIFVILMYHTLKLLIFELLISRLPQTILVEKCKIFILFYFRLAFVASGIQLKK